MEEKKKYSLVFELVLQSCQPTDFVVWIHTSGIAQNISSREISLRGLRAGNAPPCPTAVNGRKKCKPPREELNRHLGNSWLDDVVQI